MSSSIRSCEFSTITSGTERKRGFVGIVPCWREPLLKLPPLSLIIKPPIYYTKKRIEKYLRKPHSNILLLFSITFLTNTNYPIIYPSLHLCNTSKLRLIQFIISSLPLHKLLMVSSLTNFSFIHHKYFICLFNSRKPMCNHK